jgi:phage-related holin
MNTETRIIVAAVVTAAIMFLFWAFTIGLRILLSFVAAPMVFGIVALGIFATVLAILSSRK